MVRATRQRVLVARTLRRQRTARNRSYARPRGSRLKGTKRDLGDFQTPPELADEVLRFLARRGKPFTRILEPTCGRGNFIASLLQWRPPGAEIIGIDIQQAHLEQARSRFSTLNSVGVRLLRANLFELDLDRDLCWHSDGGLLVVGNPPWITSAALSTLASQNRPARRNPIKPGTGMDSITGESNFDLAEAVWIKLIEELAGQHPMIALLCKTSVARRVLRYIHHHRLATRWMALVPVDSRRWFGVNASACLFCMDFADPGSSSYQVQVYSDLDAPVPSSIFGFVRGRLVADVDAYRETCSIEGSCPKTWRQGIKHDCSEVMELVRSEGGIFENQRGESIPFESNQIYPLLKGSDLFHGRHRSPRRWVILTQNKIGQDTRWLEQSEPMLWRYLMRHRERLDGRRSAIYRGQPPFAMFGVGEYSFAPYKVGISGLHKDPRFRAIPPLSGQPVMLDDTCYFLSCSSAFEASILSGLTNHPKCLDFIGSMLFRDAKRPITKRLLQRLDLRALLNRLDRSDVIERALTELTLIGPDDTNPAAEVDRILDQLF